MYCSALMTRDILPYMLDNSIITMIHKMILPGQTHFRYVYIVKKNKHYFALHVHYTHIGCPYFFVINTRILINNSCLDTIEILKQPKSEDKRSKDDPRPLLPLLPLFVCF